MFEPDAELLNSVIATSDLQSVLADFSECINEPELGVSIAPDGIYCQKTGYQIAVRDRNSLLQLLQICGKDVAGNLYNATSLCVHPAWVSSGPDDLDNLIDADPIGYACFCFDILTREFYKNNHPKPQDNRKLPFAEKYWSLARANALMRERGAADLTELNIALARLISFMPDANSYLFAMIGKFAKTSDALAQLHCNGELVALLDTATNTTLDNIGLSRKYAKLYIEKTRFIDDARTPEDAARGPSNIRKQKVSREKVEDATMFAELIKIAKENGLDLSFQATNLPGSTAWRNRIKEKETKKEMEIMAELSMLASFSNVALPEVPDEDENDNEVEHRFLTPENPSERANGEAVQSETIHNHPINENNDYNTNNEIIPDNTPKPKLTGLALIRTKKAGLC